MQRSSVPAGHYVCKHALKEFLIIIIIIAMTQGSTHLHMKPSLSLSARRKSLRQTSSLSVAIAITFSNCVLSFLLNSHGHCHHLILWMLFLSFQIPIFLAFFCFLYSLFLQYYDCHHYFLPIITLDANAIKGVVSLFFEFPWISLLPLFTSNLAIA